MDPSSYGDANSKNAKYDGVVPKKGPKKKPGVGNIPPKVSRMEEASPWVSKDGQAGAELDYPKKSKDKVKPSQFNVPGEVRKKIKTTIRGGMGAGRGDNANTYKDPYSGEY